MSAIANVIAREILDSRVNPAIEVDVVLESGAMGRAAVGGMGARHQIQRAVGRNDIGVRIQRPIRIGQHREMDHLGDHREIDIGSRHAALGPARVIPRAPKIRPRRLDARAQAADEQPGAPK